MSGHSYREVDVQVDGGALRAGVWEPDAAPGAHGAPTVLLIHGVTSSHLAWPFVVERLPGVRVIAPDLRGRGRSNDLSGPAGMAAHADDLAALLDALGVAQTLVVGHSMGGFVSVVLAHRHPELVSRLVLVDGGMPLDVPAGLDADTLVAGILGPTAQRLGMRFATASDYLDFWRRHPAFAHDWSPELEAYLAYDLVDDGDGALRPATSYQTTAEDTVDMNTGEALPAALGALRHPTVLLTVPRGLQDEPPGLYSADYLDGILGAFGAVAHRRIPGFNHYTIVLSAAGAEVVAAVIRAELSAAAAEVSDSSRYAL
ncbi:alpha/beta fold hydrolase [Microbacterium hominis]|uniref:Alpha/beta hydrolase n=1 Tax=Microbacterium hominis TaxID=162426 RepID=A0A7D4UG68_9MICO|nr:alpha/beta hydrolase [Microbacterium hominis]QKJ19209.1 alpha/beta hydrolase [Microbacterium hominis]